MIKQKTFRASPACNKKGDFLFDQVNFDYDPIQWLDDRRSLRARDASLSELDIVRRVTKNIQWKWAVGNMPIPNIAESSYCRFAFDKKAKDCFSGLIPPPLFFDIGQGYALLILDNEPQGVAWRTERGQTIVGEDFFNLYTKCGLSGLQFSDPSVSPWKK